MCQIVDPLGLLVHLDVVCSTASSRTDSLPRAGRSQKCLPFRCYFRLFFLPGTSRLPRLPKTPRPRHLFSINCLRALVSAPNAHARPLFERPSGAAGGGVMHIMPSFPPLAARFPSLAADPAGVQRAPLPMICVLIVLNYAMRCPGVLRGSKRPVTTANRPFSSSRKAQHGRID
ncbi:hypothetical protein VTN96DRAFT_956 [Rasamsonia emersonii]